MNQITILPGSGAAVLPASLRDFKAIHRLERICFEQDAWPLLDVLGVLTIPQVIRLKAVIGDQLVGFIAADLRRSQATAWIATLAVLPSRRRQGIGEGLLTVCEDQIDLPKIRLCVRESNHSAIQLYHKFHYRQVDIWKKYYRGGENALVFEKMPRAIQETAKTSPDSPDH